MIRSSLHFGKTILTLLILLCVTTNLAWAQEKEKKLPDTSSSLTKQEANENIEYGIAIATETIVERGVLYLEQSAAQKDPASTIAIMEEEEIIHSNPIIESPTIDNTEITPIYHKDQEEK